MITINKKNPSPGEITTSLINATDGAGLHFDGTSGNIELASPPPNLGTKFSFELVIQADEWPDTNAYLIDFYGTTPRFILARELTTSYNLGIYDDASWKSFGVKVLDDLKVHHLVFTIDGTAAILYDNGNQVGSVTISANHGIDLCTAARIGSDYLGTNKFFAGNIFRARFFNKTLSPENVTSVYESASLDYADQWGSQTELVTNGTFTGGTTGWALGTVSYGTNNIDWPAMSGLVYIRQTTWSITEGEKYRLTFDVSGHSADGALELWDYSVNNLITTLESIAGNGTITHEFTALKSSSGGVLLGKDPGTFVGTMDNVACVRIGCVSDFDLSYANPSQSDIVRNRNDTVTADGTAAGGVVQITAIDQLNSKSARIGTTAATPADGELLVSGNVGIGTSAPSSFHANASNLVVGSGAGTEGVTINSGSSNYGVIYFADGTVGSAAYVGNIGYNHSDNSMRLGTNGSTTDVVIASSGLATFSNGITVSAGTANFAGSYLNVGGGYGATGLSISDAGVLQADGLATFSSGIAFSSQTESTAGTPAASSVLNHYETGIFTPVPWDNDATQMTTSIQLGSYIRVGKIVYCTFNFKRNDTATLTNTLYIRGLPFVFSNNVQTKNIGIGSSWLPSDSEAGLNYGLENTSSFIVQKNNASGYILSSDLSNLTDCYGALTYEADV